MLSLVTTLVVLASPPRSLVAPPWRTVQVPADLAEFYSDHLAQALRHTGLKVVTSSEVSSLISLERQKQLLGCAGESASCIAELGAALGCDGVLLVSLAKLEDEYRGNVKVVNAVDGSVLAETTVEATGQKALLGALDEGARRLAQSLGVGAPPQAPSGRLKTLWWVPASVAALGAVAAGVGLVGSRLSYDDLSRRLASSQQVTDSEVRLASGGKALQVVGWAGVAVAAAGLVTMGAFLLFGGDPGVSPAVTLVPGGAVFGLRVTP